MQWSCSACDNKYHSVKEYIDHLMEGKCDVDVERIYNLGIITEDEYKKIVKVLEKKFKS